MPIPFSSGISRFSNIKRPTLSSSNRFYQETKKSQQKSCNLLYFLLLGIVFITGAYLLFVWHITISPESLRREISHAVHEIKAVSLGIHNSYRNKSYSTQSNIENAEILQNFDHPQTNIDTQTYFSSKERCPNRKPIVRMKLPKNRTEKGASNMHFIHIPKCGGTSMTAVLREMACAMNPTVNVDCCKNPGFCDWHAFRRCSVIKGCTDHFPNRAWIFKPQPSIALFREPSSRLLSAWFYRGHSPNLDFFQVRPWFKDIQLGKRPKVIFEEYIEMIEYQNIQTRMLGADSFPYRNINITEEVYCNAVEALDNLFFIGLQEAYDISVQALLREFDMNIIVEVKKERDQGNRQITEEKEKLKRNIELMNRVKEVNRYDIDLYQLAVEKFCKMIRKYDDLYAKLKATTKVECPRDIS